MAKDRYLLSSQVFVDYFKKSEPHVTAFMEALEPGEAFISVLTLGIVEDAINVQPIDIRTRFLQNFGDGKNAFRKFTLPVNDDVVEQWIRIRQLDVTSPGARGTTHRMGEDEKLIIATALSHGMVYLGFQPEPVDRLDGLGLIVRNPYAENS